MKKNTLITLLLVSIGTQAIQAATHAPTTPSTAPTNAAYPPTTPGGKIDFNNIPPMSPDELAKWEEEVTKEIDQYVGTLSPEDQAQFHKEVEELTNVMSKMSPDELVKFIDTMLTEDQQALPAPTPIPQPTAPTTEPDVEEKKTTAEKTPELPLNSVEAALNLIDDLIMHTERFLRKSIMIPELPGNIEQWVSKNKIREWKNNLTWEILKADIEALNKQFNHLKDRDPKTKNYLYLSKLIEQESLYNNLIHVKQALVRHEPNVEAPAFGLGTVTPKSHDAIKQVLNTLAEAIYTLHVPTAITKVLGTSHAREKELKEEEEKSRKQAFEHSKRPQAHEGKRETIVPQQSRGGYYGGEQPSYPSSGGYQYPDNSYYGPNAYNNAKPGTTAGKPGAAGAPGKETKPGTGEKEKKGAAETAKKPSLDDTGKGLINKIDKALEKFAESYDDSLRTMHAQLAGGAAMDNKLHDAINKAQTHINNALDLAKKLRTRVRTNQSPAEAVKDALRDVAVPYKERIDNLIKQIGTLKTTRGLVIPPAVDALYTALTDFNKEVGAGTVTNVSMPTEVPVKPTKPMPEETGKGTTGAGKQKPAKESATQGHALTPFHKQKLKLDDTIEDAELALDKDKIKNLRAHITNPNTSAEIETARALTDAVDACKLVTNRAGSLKSTIGSLTPADRKKLNAGYAEFRKTLTALEHELDSLTKLDVSRVELGKRYAFFGQEMTSEMIEKAHPADAAKRKELEALKKELPTPTTLSAFLKAVHDALEAMKKL